MSFKVLLFALSFTSLLALDVQALEKSPTVTGDYCKDDIMLYFQQKYGDTVKVGQMIKDRSRERNGRGWIYWVKSDVCSGYHVFDFAYLESGKCAMPHYGRRPQYVSRVWGHGRDCRNLIDGIQEFPRLDIPGND